MNTRVRPSSSLGSAKLRFALSCDLLILALAACTTSQAPTSVAPPPSSNQASSTPSSAPVSRPTLAPTQPVAPTVTSSTAATQPTQVPAPANSPTLAKSFQGFRLPDIDPCKLLSQADVEKALGKPIKSATASSDQNTGAKGCFYLNDPGMSFVTLTYWQGDDAKMQLLGSIAQMHQKGCSISVTATTRRATPTPLPPEVDALKSKPLVDLFGVYAQLLKEKCPPGTQELSALGESALMDSMLHSVHIVAGEAYVMFLLADNDLTEQKQIEGVRLLAGSLFK
jgi:hypothetical protein